MNEINDIKIGQVYKDADPRIHGGRTLDVIRVQNKFVFVTCRETERTTRIRKDRLKYGNRGYEKVG